MILSIDHLVQNIELKPENALLLVEQQLAQNPTDVLLRCRLNEVLGGVKY